MTNLVDVLENTGKGFVTGAARVVDLAGAVIAEVDYEFSGAGPSDKVRGNDTIYNHIYKAVYSDHAEKQKMGTSYVPRLVGNVLGTAGAIGAGYLLWTGVGALAALTIPIVTGIYSLVRGGIRYGKDMVHGEKIGDTFQKGSFSDGYKFGWHSSTSFLASIIQPFESNLTGRGYDNSHFKGELTTKAARGARRNLASMFGAFVGKVVGGVVNTVSHLIFPIYKTAVGTQRCVKDEEPSENYSPSYVVAAA